MFIPFVRGWYDGRRPPQHERPAPQELPPAPRGTHYHVCIEAGCRIYVTCTRGPECPVGAWTCPACERDEMDRWITEEEGRRHV
jgi:hypothetical protein